MAAIDPPTSWPPPRHSDLAAPHDANDEWCVCGVCSARRGAAIRAKAERLLAELMLTPASNDQECEPFDWQEPMPLGETELSGEEPGYRTVTGKLVRHDP